MTAGGAGVLTTDADVPEVAETAVELDLLHALEVVAHLGVDVVRVALEPLAGLAVLQNAN